MCCHIAEGDKWGYRLALKDCTSLSACLWELRWIHQLRFHCSGFLLAYFHEVCFFGACWSQLPLLMILTRLTVRGLREADDAVRIITTGSWPWMKVTLVTAGPSVHRIVLTRWFWMVDQERVLCIQKAGMLTAYFLCLAVTLIPYLVPAEHISNRIAGQRHMRDKNWLLVLHHWGHYCNNGVIADCLRSTNWIIFRRLHYLTDICSDCLCWKVTKAEIWSTNKPSDNDLHSSIKCFANSPP